MFREALAAEFYGLQIPLSVEMPPKIAPSLNSCNHFSELNLMTLQSNVSTPICKVYHHTSVAELTAIQDWTPSAFCMKVCRPKCIVDATCDDAINESTYGQQLTF